MEKKKAKLWIILLVGVLILGIGGSFAYFVTRVLSNGNGAEVNTKTARKGDTTVKVEGIMESDVSGKYPGHKSISAIKVTATGEDNVSFNLTWIGTSTLTFQINYTVYKTFVPADASINCQVKTKENVDLSMYYFEECTEQVSNLGEIKEADKIDSNVENQKYKLITNEKIQATKEGTEVYYYIILEIPNLNYNQNQNIGGKIFGDLSIEIIPEYDKCKGPACEAILANNILKEETPDFNYSSGGYNVYLYGGDTTYLHSFAKDSEIAQNEIDENMKLYTILDSDGNDMYTDYTGTLFDESIETAFLGDGVWDSENNKCTYTDADGNINDVYSFITWDVIQDERECNKVYLEYSWGGLGYISFSKYKYLGIAKDVLTHESAPATEGLYMAEDDDGESYYFRGDVNNNYVKFANFYWRIVRINGDGSIRLIYDGDKAYTNKNDYANREIGTTKYNNYADDNSYIGYMYGQTGSEIYEETHANKNSSVIKNTVENWYKLNILDKGYDEFINQNSVFCGDRSVSTGTGIGSEETQYKAYDRLETNKTPTFKCINNVNDLYSANYSFKGNKALTYPVGLITADELAYAGLLGKGSRNTYFGKVNHYYWTMTPKNKKDLFVGVYYGISSSVVNGTASIRPVINLNANVNFTGSGTMEDPYTVS